jgi:hypothetical protein
MIQEPTIQPVPTSPGDEDEPTEPRLPAQRVRTSPTANVLQVRHNGGCTISIDEQGSVTVVVPGRDVLILRPEEAFDLLDFLFEYRNLLAARSAEVAER